MRILCFGDSLALPREGCLYQETWIAKMKATYPTVDFICYLRGGMLVHDMINYWKYMQYADADLAIIQEGICDCAPRYINEKSLFWKIIIKIAQKTRTSKMFWWFIKRGSRKTSCTCTSIQVFANKYNEMLKNMYLSGLKKVIIVKIGHGATSVIKKSMHFNTNVDAYNQVFDQLKKEYGEKLILVDPLCNVDEDMFVDGYHCNAKGMGLVYNQLNKVLLPMMVNSQF